MPAHDKREIRMVELFILLLCESKMLLSVVREWSRFQLWVRTAEHSCDYTRVKAKLLDHGLDRYLGISDPTNRALADGDSAPNLARPGFARMSCRTDKRDPYGLAAARL